MRGTDGRTGGMCEAPVGFGLSVPTSHTVDICVFIAVVVVVVCVLCFFLIPILLEMLYIIMRKKRKSKRIGMKQAFGDEQKVVWKFGG